MASCKILICLILFSKLVNKQQSFMPRGYCLFHSLATLNVTVCMTCGKKIPSAVTCLPGPDCTEFKKQHSVKCLQNHPCFYSHHLGTLEMDDLTLFPISYTVTLCFIMYCTNVPLKDTKIAAQKGHGKILFLCYVILHSCLLHCLFVGQF